MFCHEQIHNCDVNNMIEVSQQFKLTRISQLHGVFDETMSLATANVQNDEEMLLTQRSGPVNIPTNRPMAVPILNDDCDSDETNAPMAGPTQESIELATADIESQHFSIPAIVNIDELVLQSDVSDDRPWITMPTYLTQLYFCSFYFQMQYDIRKIVISLANACAYVIGAGPYASRIIFMLKQRLMQKKRLESDTQQCLIDMGFSQVKVHHALHINKYVLICVWLALAPMSLISSLRY